MYYLVGIYNNLRLYIDKISETGEIETIYRRGNTPKDNLVILKANKGIGLAEMKKTCQVVLDHFCKELSLENRGLIYEDFDNEEEQNLTELYSYINLNIPIEEIPWTLTDPATNQYGRQTGPKRFEFKEDGKEQREIDLDDYDVETIEDAINTYGHTLKEGGNNVSDWIIAECLYELDIE